MAGTTSRRWFALRTPLSLRSKMLVGFGLLFAVTLLLTNVMRTFGIPLTGYTGSYGEEISRMSKHLDLVAELKKERLLLWLEERKADLITLSNDPVIKSRLPLFGKTLRAGADRRLHDNQSPTELTKSEEYRIILNRLLLSAGKRPVYKKILVSDGETGVVIASTDESDIGTDSFKETYFLGALKLRGNISVTVHSGESGSNPYLVFSGLIAHEGGEGAGSSVISMFVDMDSFVGPLQHMGKALGTSGEVFLADQDSVILSPLKYALPDGSVARPMKTMIRARPPGAVGDDRSGVFDGPDYRGVPVLGAYRSIDVASGLVPELVVKIDRSEVTAPAWRRLLLTVILSLVGLSAAGGLAVLIATRISRPIWNLSETAREVASGNMDARAVIQGSSEVRALCATFNSMIEQIRDRHEQLDEQVFDLSVLHNVATALASTVDLDEMLSIVIKEVNKALLSEGAGVLLYDENKGDLFWRRVQDAGEKLASRSEELRLPLDRSIAGWVFTHNESAIVNDTSQDPRYYPEVTRRSGFDIRKVLQVPLNSRDRTIGVLMVMNKIGGDFSIADESLLTSMASIIALAIDNATVYEKLKKSTVDLEMIYRSSIALANTMDIDHLLNVVLEELKTALDTEAVGVMLHDEMRGDLYWRAGIGHQGFLDRLAGEMRLPLDRSVSGRVFRTGEPALVNDPAAGSLIFKPFEAKTGFVVRNVIIVPLNTREKTIGVMAVMNRRGGRFTNSDVQLLSSMAGVLALAVENAAFFQEMLTSYREMEELNRVKTKILNHLSHELRTPLAIIKGTVVTMWRKLKEQGIHSYDKSLQRIARRIQSLNRLETQVESIMMTGYAWEKRNITEFLAAALELMELQKEYTPEIAQAVTVLHQWMEKTFPTRKDEPERINVKAFGDDAVSKILLRVREVGRKVEISTDLEPDADLMIPSHVLPAIIEGLVRNAVEATPDHGRVEITGRVKGDRYILTVKDTGIGIPDKEKEFIFQGFYPVQETEDYSSRQPFSFNAGGRGIDLLRIKMFSEFYGFRLSFTSRRCPKLGMLTEQNEGEPLSCANCRFIDNCADYGGSEFVVDFPLADSKAALDVLQDEKRTHDPHDDAVFLELPMR